MASETRPTPHRIRTLSPEAVELIASRFKVLSEPLRLQLIMALEPGEQSVTRLVKDSGATQTSVSRHLQALMRSGILARRKEGSNVYYRIADPAIFELCDHVCGSLARQFSQQAETARWFS